MRLAVSEDFFGRCVRRRLIYYIFTCTRAHARVVLQKYVREKPSSAAAPLSSEIDVSPSRDFEREN